MNKFREYCDGLYIAFSAVVIIMVSFHAGRLDALTEYNFPDYQVIAGLFVITGAPLLIAYILLDYILSKIIDK